MGGLGAILLGVYIRVPDFGKLPYMPDPKSAHFSPRLTPHVWSLCRKLGSCTAPGALINQQWKQLNACRACD